MSDHKGIVTRADLGVQRDSDAQVGAFEIKDATTNNRAVVGVDGSVLVKLTGGGSSAIAEATDDDDISGASSDALVIGKNYVFDGVSWERLQSDGSGAIKVAQTGATGAGAVSAATLRVVEAAASTVIQDEASVVGAGAGDRTQLPNQVVSSVQIQAHSDNSSAVYIGGSAVTNMSGARRGIELQPGDSYGPLSIDNLNTIYIAGDTSGDKISYLGI